MEKSRKISLLYLWWFRVNQYFDRLINQILNSTIKIEELEKQILLLKKWAKFLKSCICICGFNNFDLRDHTSLGTAAVNKMQTEENVTFSWKKLKSAIRRKR